MNNRDLLFGTFNALIEYEEVKINNQRGEIVTGVMVVIMVGMMIFGMVFMRGGHGDRHDHKDVEHKQEHTDKGHQSMHEGLNATEQALVSATEEKNN